MHFHTSSRQLVLIVMLLCITHSAYPVRPSAFLKRSLLRRRLLAMPGLRPKRQLFREDIPHHRPLTGNTYYLHAGFPHPSRWYDGAQVIQPDPNPITHHHFHKKPSLHDDPNDNNNNHDHHDNNNNHVNHHIHQDQQLHHLNNHNGLYDHREPAITVVNNQTPHTVNIHSDIVHSNGAYGGNGVVDNAIGNPAPHPPHSPADQANFDPLFSQLISGPVDTGHIRNTHQKRPGKPPKPHSDPEPYDDYGTGGGDYGTPFKGGPYYGTPEPVHPAPEVPPINHHKYPERKPKTIIHYHPVTVGNIINFNDDNQPAVIKPNNPHSYGPPDHVPGIPLANKDTMLSIADPFIKSPFKTVNGPPGFLDFSKDENVQYGPPQHIPGVPLSNLDLSPMLPSFGPPVKPETEGVIAPPYGVALPVIAHLHSGPPRPHLPPKHHRGKGRSYHQHHLHLHHIHHQPPRVHGPIEHPPSYVVRGHVPNKFTAFHNHRFQSHTHHHHHHPKPYWGW